MFRVLYEMLLQQTAAIKSTLSGLEADFGASRRDMGWLQENLTTVQTAAGAVSDKVVKLQSQVANMERQIGGAVKVPIPLITPERRDATAASFPVTPTLCLVY